MHPSNVQCSRTRLIPALVFSAVMLVANGAADAVAVDALPRHWVDEQGRPFDLGRIAHDVTVVTMAYATCHRVCPRTMQRLQQLQDVLDREQARAEFVIVGYDPESDDPAAWRQYRRTRGLSRPNWHFLTGSPPQVARFAQLLGFEYWKADQHVMHDERIVLLDPVHGVTVDPAPETLHLSGGSEVQP